MLTLTSFFEPVDEQTRHPLLKKLAKYRALVPEPEIRILIERENFGLTFGEPKLAVIVRPQGDERPITLRDRWDNDLNRVLVQFGYRAISPSVEILRYALALRTDLRPVEVRYGDGYYNSVLVDFVHRSPFGKVASVVKVLDSVHRDARNRNAASFSECKAMIHSIINLKGFELKHYLEYEISECEIILSGAIAQYLDERFSVSNRKLLGWA